jgi:cold shock CspA family protein
MNNEGPKGNRLHAEAVRAAKFQEVERGRRLEFAAKQSAAASEAARPRVMRLGQDVASSVICILIGLFALLWGFWGWVIGILLFVVGGIASNRFRCSACMNRVDRHAKLCPICRAGFQ